MSFPIYNGASKLWVGNERVPEPFRHTHFTVENEGPTLELAGSVPAPVSAPSIRERVHTPFRDTLVRVAAEHATVAPLTPRALQMFDYSAVPLPDVLEKAAMLPVENREQVKREIGLASELAAAHEREAALRNELHALRNELRAAAEREHRMGMREVSLLGEIAAARNALEDARAEALRARAAFEEVTAEVRALRHEAKPRPRVEIVVDNGWDD